jgi:hypothetical protein
VKEVSVPVVTEQPRDHTSKLRMTEILSYVRIQTDFDLNDPENKKKMRCGIIDQ